MKIFFGIFLLSISLLEAQVLKQVEKETTNDNHLVINLEKEGILVVDEVSKTKMQLVRYDNELQEIWQIEADIKPDAEYVGYHVEGKFAYLLFRLNEPNYLLLKVSIANGSIEKHTFYTFKSFDIFLFKVRNEVVYLGGAIDEEPVLLSVAVGKSTPRVLGGGLGKGATIQSLEFNPYSDNLLLTYLIKRDKKINVIVLKEITPSGQTLGQKVLESDSKYAFLSGKVFVVDEKLAFLIGNYGFRGSHLANPPQSQGIYISPIHKDKNSHTDYYAFTDFENFFSFLNEKQQDKIDKQIEKKRAKGAEYRLNYRVLVHDIVLAKDSSYLLIAEVFIPQFSSVNNYWSPYGTYSRSLFRSSYYYWGSNAWAWNPALWNSTTPYASQQFDGFKYTHAIVASFDSKGKLLWDNAIPYKNIQSFDLKEKLQLNTEKDDYIVAHSDNEHVFMQKFNKNMPPSKKEQVDVVQQEDSQVLFSEAESWYGNYFFVWGYRRGSSGSKMFFLSKIAY